MTKELICHANYAKGMCIYDVEREEYDDHIDVLLYKVAKRKKTLQGHSPQTKTLASKIEYKNVGREYKHQFLSWYNLFFCSKCYAPITDNAYMETAVQRGMKTAATVLHLSTTTRKGQRFKRHLPESCGFVIYGETGFFVYNKGTLRDFFDMEEVMQIYASHGIDDLDWKEIFALSKIDLADYGNYMTSPFSLHSPVEREYFVLDGLLLGYPVESTVALLKKDVYRYDRDEE